MNKQELRKTESFLAGRSRTAKLRDKVFIQGTQTSTYGRPGNYAITVQYSVKAQGNLWQQQTIVASFEEAVDKLGAAE
jgi:hypothetical protein